MGPDTLCLQMGLVLVAAASAETLSAAQPCPGTYRLKKAYFSPWTARTADASNYTTMSLRKGSTEIATEAVSVADLGNLVAHTPVELVLTGTGTDLEFAQGAAISFLKVETGTGMALDGQVSLYFEKVRV